MKKYLLGIAVALFLPLFAASAHAQTPGFTTTDVHMRAGPGTNYPAVATLPPNASIEVYGCQAGYDWCDISWNSARGWISSTYILTESNGQKVVLTPAVAATIGITIVVFNQAYWNNYYKHYPWYPYWNRYYHPVHPYHPVPDPYCYHSPQAPECHYGPYHPYHPYDPYYGSGHHQIHPDGFHGGRHGRH
jgi:uncharacterized protein YraI